MDIQENFRNTPTSKSSDSRSGASYSRSRSNQSRSTKVNTKINTNKNVSNRAYRTPTLGGTGGGPFWGWSYYPYSSTLYPNIDYVPNQYNLIELKPEETNDDQNTESDQNEKFINIKTILPSYK